jgi:hypothetical protein
VPCGLWAASAPGLTRTGFGRAMSDAGWGAGKGLRRVGRREIWARKGQMQEGQMQEGQMQEGQAREGQARRERLTAERTARIEAVTVFVSMPTPQKT